MRSYPTINQCRLARKLLRSGTPMAQVIEALGGRFSESEIRQAIVAQQARERAYNGYDQKTPSQLGIMPGGGQRTSVPRDLFADRNRRLAFRHTSIIARVCGDPPPERSALHCPSPPSTLRDPLRNLISPFRRRDIRSANVGEPRHDRASAN